MTRDNDMDPGRFPLATAYLERLARGVDTHPQCELKAAIFIDQLASRPLSDDDLRQLPGEVRDLAKSPPPVSAWIPEVLAMTYTIALRDVYFGGPGGDQAYEAWTYERNRRLLNGRLYRAVFLLVSPDRLFRNIDRRWGRMRRGSTLEVLEHSPGGARLRSHYPSHLHDESIALGMRGAFRAAAELAGAHEVDIDPPLVEERTTTFTIRYRV